MNPPFCNPWNPTMTKLPRSVTWTLVPWAISVLLTLFSASHSLSNWVMASMKWLKVSNAQPSSSRFVVVIIVVVYTSSTFWPFCFTKVIVLSTLAIVYLSRVVFVTLKKSTCKKLKVRAWDKTGKCGGTGTTGRSCNCYVSPFSTSSPTICLFRDWKNGLQLNPFLFILF